jgi:hypothetical protein
MSVKAWRLHELRRGARTWRWSRYDMSDRRRQGLRAEPAGRILAKPNAECRWRAERGLVVGVLQEVGWQNRQETRDG